MVGVNVALDYPSSAIISYHILCAPTSLTLKHNPELYDAFDDEITLDEKHEYLEMFGDLTRQNIHNMRTRFFSPDNAHRNFMDVIEKLNYGDSAASIIRFEDMFKDYWDKLALELNPLVPEREELYFLLADEIYDIAHDLTGIEVKKPSDVGVRVVEGLSPTSFAQKRGDTEYVVQQSRQFKSDTGHMSTFIHELVPHKLLGQFRNLHKNYFGDYKYEFEEGVVKSLTNVIGQRLYRDDTIDFSKPPRDKNERIAFDIAERKKEQLNGNVYIWYDECLSDIASEVKK